LPITNATSLRTLLNSEILKEEIIASFVSELAAIWHEENLATTWPTKASIRDYKSNCVTIGQDINVQLVGKEIIQGTVIDVLDSGELQVKTELKTLNLTSADITLSH
ncbi:MAG: hypothetical protein ACKOXS_08170, partial [Actinomycetes bacterium]